ncbi:Pkinase-domain-containing protein [Amanita rubescens]|nr:Pkinase-domain-containing protein [Amanita rubescens]KAF8351106.1 Pkinase-domain-containing protein [Amanita rubescens]
MLRFWPSTPSEQLTPKARTDRNPFDAVPSPTASGQADLTPLLSTQLSLHAPEFKMQQPPPGRKEPSSSSMSSISSSSTSPPHTSTSKGQIHVKLIQARSLNVRSIHARPYVVVQFEQNEFVSRDPTDETDKEVKGVATTLSRINSSNSIATLAPKLTDKQRAKSANSSPSSSISSKSSGIANGFFGRLSPHNPVWKHQVSFDVTSEDSLITFTVYDRSVSDLGFLGTLQIKPALAHDHTVDQWYKLLSLENEPVTGEMRVQITFEQYKVKRALTPRDFEFLKLIGRGTFGKVFQVRKKDTKRIFAMKVLSKKEIVAKKEIAHTIGERKILQCSLESPFLVGLKFSFQTDTDLYLVTDFKSGGELFWHLQRETRFSEERARFYIAELILALEHLHKYNIVYRDLKPENILLDATGHVALCDFGLSKADLRPDELTTTFCGTTEYLAPEILLDEQGYSKIVDFWSLGVLLFEMCCGWSPFYAEDTQQMYKNICFGKIRFPKGVICEDGKQFVKGLLNRNPKHRLGAQRDAEELKVHPFFKTIDWKALYLKQVTPPFKPVVESDESTNNFDPEFTSADIESDIANMDLDEEDPSEDWVSQSIAAPSGFVHTPNGPLGSERRFSKASGNGNTSNGNSNGRGIQIKRKKRKDAAGSPLTNSVQEKFKGFTFSGGDSIVPPSALQARKKADEENAVDDEEAPEVTTEDEFEDTGRSAGRYANMRRKGLGFSTLDDC